ncbi:MAG TPA: hypothetical protein PKD59_00775 [Miltoncostaeaceae bacterium]|nr:hypothetical protein [Miltoncostaeaceae bacterium]
MTRILPLTAATRHELPAPCVSCVFWQHDRIVTDEGRKEAWSKAQGGEHGSFGRVLSDDSGFRGMIQYGPSNRFPRALALPAGPPDPRGALVTCVFLEGDDPVGMGERLLLEALADLKGRGMRAVEAFALGYPDDVPIADRFVGHHTLFDRDFLAALGFARVRTRGQVSLMRLELGGLQPATGVLGRVAAALRLPAERGPSPA